MYFTLKKYENNKIVKRSYHKQKKKKKKINNKKTNISQLFVHSECQFTQCYFSVKCQKACAHQRKFGRALHGKYLMKSLKSVRKYKKFTCVRQAIEKREKIAIHI